MSKRLTASRQKNRLTGRRCEVQGCGLPVQKIGRLCDRHDGIEVRTGHPLGTTIRAGHISHFVKQASRYILANKDHVAIAACLQWLQEYVYGQRTRAPEVRPNASARERLSHWLSRLKQAGVYDYELMAVVVALYMLREWEPRTFRSDRHFRHQLALRFVRKAPAPPVLKWRGGAGGLRYDRVSVGTRELLARELEAAIGLICFRIAKLVLTKPNTPTPEQQAAMRAALPVNTEKGKLHE
jgi:hypothetical protein